MMPGATKNNNMATKKYKPKTPRIYCSEETIKEMHKWMMHFRFVYRKKVTYEDILVRAMECLELGEIEVADSKREWELKIKHQRELNNQKE